MHAHGSASPYFGNAHGSASPYWQVHRAVLRTGEEVVVKVQRENLLDLFAIDLWNIKLAAWLADRFDPQTEATAANWKVR